MACERGRERRGEEKTSISPSIHLWVVRVEGRKERERENDNDEYYLCTYNKRAPEKTKMNNKARLDGKL